MKILFDPDNNLYRYRCNGILCNPNPANFTKSNNLESHKISMIYCSEDQFEIHGWTRIICKNGVLHLCPECTDATLDAVKDIIVRYISEMVDIQETSSKIASLLFDLDLYEEIMNQ